MLNFIDEMSESDFVATFSGTYVMHGDKPIYVESYNWHERFVYQGDSHIPFEQLDFSLPDVGMFWYNGQLYYAAIRAQRQWRRGFRTSRCTFYKLMPNGESIITTLPSSVASIVMAKQSKHDAVLSRDFGRRGKWLFFRSLPLGTVDADNVVTCELTIKPELPEGYVYA